MFLQILFTNQQNQGVYHFPLMLRSEWCVHTRPKFRIYGTTIAGTVSLPLVYASNMETLHLSGWIPIWSDRLQDVESHHISLTGKSPLCLIANWKYLWVALEVFGDIDCGYHWYAKSTPQYGKLLIREAYEKTNLWYEVLKECLNAQELGKVSGSIEMETTSPYHWHC